MNDVNHIENHQTYQPQYTTPQSQYVSPLIAPTQYQNAVSGSRRGMGTGGYVVLAISIIVVLIVVGILFFYDSEDSSEQEFCYVVNDPNFNSLGCSDTTTSSACKGSVNSGYKASATKCQYGTSCDVTTNRPTGCKCTKSTDCLGTCLANGTCFNPIQGNTTTGGSLFI